MQIVKSCSNCYYAKNEADDKNEKYCIVKKESINTVNCCGYYLQNQYKPTERTG